MKAVAYFHTWWALRGEISEEYDATFTNSEYADFFNACRPGFLALTFVALGKLFDRRAIGLVKLEKILRQQGFTKEATIIKSLLNSEQGLITRIRGIRNKAISHNQPGTTRDAVFRTYGVTPNEIRELVQFVRTAMKQVGRRLGFERSISDGIRQEHSVNAVMRKLAK